MDNDYAGGAPDVGAPPLYEPRGELGEPVIDKPGLFWPILLFTVTAITTTTAGALYLGADLKANPMSLLRGLPFSSALLLILGTHELGHYFASRRHGVTATLPFFIPGPPIPPMIGTFGAVIKMKSPIRTREALVDIGAAGPLAGFVVAIVIVAWGLSLSDVLLISPFGEIFNFGLGGCLIFKFLSYVIHGSLPEGADLLLHPVAFAGWLGLFVTSINLLPIGQLDGGHILYAVFGRAHRAVSILMVLFLLVLGLFTWKGWMIWAGMVMLIGIWHPPVVNQSGKLDRRRRVVSFVTLVVFILTFIPIPFYIY